MIEYHLIVMDVLFKKGCYWQKVKVSRIKKSRLKDKHLKNNEG